MSEDVKIYPEKLAASASEEHSSTAERRALIERIAASEHFGRSGRLRDFLLYVGRKSLRNGSSQIHEQEVGEKVFGRPTGYDCSQDNIVRVNASELRRRLDLYFATTGVKERLLLEIPRGSYKPVFRLRTADDATERNRHPVTNPAEEPLRELVRETVKTSGTKHIGLSERLAWITLGLLLAIACGVLALRLNRTENELHPFRRNPALAAFWSKFLYSKRQTHIVLADSSVSLNADITQHQFTLSEYLDHGYDSMPANSDLSRDRQQDVHRVFAHNLVTYGDVLAAQQILMLDPFSENLDLTTARFSTAEQFKRDSVVLIGGKKANPWVFLFDDEMDFSLEQEGVENPPLVINRHPQQGEQKVYATSTTAGEVVGYSVIAYLPNSGGTGKAIILAGTDSDATDAAAGFLTSEAQIEQLLKLFHSDRFPYFEVLLRCTELNGTPLRTQMIAFRTHPEFH
jgi:hypothetical protein